MVAFAAPSGTGKTTLIEKLVPHLKARGLRVGVIKSDAHGVELDTPGKDTHRFRQAGSETTALVSRDQLAIFCDETPRDFPIESLIELFFADLDVVLLEGFRSHDFPTIVVRRGGVDMGDWRWPKNVLAVASDGTGNESHTSVPLDDLEAIGALVLG